MALKKKNAPRMNQEMLNLDVVDLILIDHRFLKECVEILSREGGEKRVKLTKGREFLSALMLHSLAEKKAVYLPLESNAELHFNILEAQIEHGLIDQKVKVLKQKLHQTRSLKDEVEAELKVLADLVKHHLMEEESETLPKLKEAIDDFTLKELGMNFMKLRNFTAADLQDYPFLHDELIEWKDSIQKVSSEFLKKMDKFVENIEH